MSRRAAAFPLVLALSALGCQSHPEKGVVDQYFNAVNAKDSQTLSSFAAVSFDKKVDRWAIKNTLDENTEPLPLPALMEKLKQAEAAEAANMKEARAYNVEQAGALEQVKDLKARGKPVPAKLAVVATRLDEFNQKHRDARKAVAEAKDAVERERRAMALSVGTTEGLEAMQGEVMTKRVAVEVTIDGQAQPYVMTLKRYDVKREGPRVVSRWMVQSIQPQGQG